MILDLLLLKTNGNSGLQITNVICGHKSTLPTLHNSIGFCGFPYPEPYLLEVDIFLLQSPWKQRGLCMLCVLHVIVNLAKGVKGSAQPSFFWTMIKLDPWHQICWALAATVEVEFLHQTISVMWITACVHHPLKAALMIIF